MSTVIYLANQQIQIVVGTGNTKSLNIKNCITETAPEGSIINGIIMNDELFKDFLIELKKQKKIIDKEVTLVVNSTKFIGKNIEVPNMSEKRTFDFIHREYLASGRDENTNYGYITLAKNKKMKKIYAEGVDRDFIGDYIKIFNSVGIKLSGIYSGESTLIGFIGANTDKYIKTYMVMVAGVNTLTTVLFINGTFNYYNSVRCFHDKGTIEYAEDIARSVSQITQFMKSNHFEDHLEKVFLSGIDKDFLPVCANSISDAGIGCQVQPYLIKSNGGVNEFHQGYIRSIAGLIQYDKTTNYYAGYINTVKAEKAESSRGVVKTVAIIAGTVLVMFGALIGSIVWKQTKKAELDKLIKINSDPVIVEGLVKYEALDRRYDFLTNQHEAVVGLSENLKTYPRGNTKLLQVFDRCAAGYAIVTYDSFDATSGTVSVTAMATDVESINQFIKKLTEQDEFNHVDYTGYSYSDSESMWNINVVCILAESAGL